MAISARRLLLLQSVVVVMTMLFGAANGAPKELVVSYHACTEGQGCHVMDQVTFHDSHIVMLTSANYHRHLQGRVVDLGTGCPRTDGLKEKDTDSGNHNSRDRGHRGRGGGGRHHRRTVGLVRCGACPLSEILREGTRQGVNGMVITNTKECGRPTDEFLELTAGLNYPVTFVSEKVSKEIIAMRDQVLELRRQREARKDGLHRFEFVYVSAMDDGLPRLRHMLVRILASTHVLLTTVAVLAILVYFCLACSVGSLRNVPREIAPSIFGSRPEPVDQATIERLPLVQVEWDVPPSDSSRCTPSVDEESRHETPDIPSQPPPCPEKQVVQRQLASIIQTCGASSYSFTDEVMCAICLGRYTLQESLRLLPCKHAFHQKCIDAWLLSKDMTVHCPVCKCSIVDGLRLLDKHGYNEILNSLNQDPVPDVPVKPAASAILYINYLQNGLARASAAAFNSTLGRWRRQR